MSFRFLHRLTLPLCHYPDLKEAVRKKSSNTMPIHSLVLKESADLMEFLNLTLRSGLEL